MVAQSATVLGCELRLLGTRNQHSLLPTVELSCLAVLDLHLLLPALSAASSSGDATASSAGYPWVTPVHPATVKDWTAQRLFSHGSTATASTRSRPHRPASSGRSSVQMLSSTCVVAAY